MSGSPAQTSPEAAIHARIDRLSPDSVREWGTMSASEMICHVADQLRVAIGDLDAEPDALRLRFGGREARGPPGLLRYRSFRQLLVHRVPWPKRRFGAPRRCSRPPRGGGRTTSRRSTPLWTVRPGRTPRRSGASIPSSPESPVGSGVSSPGGTSTTTSANSASDRRARGKAIASSPEGLHRGTTVACDPREPGAPSRKVTGPDGRRQR